MVCSRSVISWEFFPILLIFSNHDKSGFVTEIFLIETMNSTNFAFSSDLVSQIELFSIYHFKDFQFDVKYVKISPMVHKLLVF